MSSCKVIFFEVRTAQEKLKKIFQTSLFHFERKELLLLLVPDPAAALFLDEWLWKLDETSFLPHLFSDMPSSEPIIISTKQDIHPRPSLFNLSSEMPKMEPQMKIFYEFDDTSSNVKREIAKKKFHIYRENGFLIESR